MAAKPLIHLSQSQLQILEACPRKFQHRYLEQLSPPPPPLEQDRLTWGSNFHLIMQQRELGLPVEPLIAEDEAMSNALAALLIAAPELFATLPQTVRSPEHPLTWELQGYLFTAIYDLFIANPSTVQIIDWKTYQKPQTSQFLVQQWQTKLYLYLLAATGRYSPEQISMTYWFVRTTPPQQVTIAYSQQLHQEIHQELSDLLEDLDTYLEQYQSQGLGFSQVSPTAGLCLGCSFAARCGRGDRSQIDIIQTNLTDLTDLDAIAEVAL